VARWVPPSQLLYCTVLILTILFFLRVQAGDLKYMVAFASAPAALQWALMTQEAAMYLDYPSTFDRVPQASLGW